MAATNGKLPRSNPMGKLLGCSSGILDSIASSENFLVFVVHATTKTIKFSCCNCTRSCGPLEKLLMMWPVARSASEPLALC
jgi:hypothetical protein